MKKTFSIIILLVYLSSFTEFRELLKLPLLLEHFTEHSSKDSSLSFSEFLCMHYLHAHDNDGDDEHDRNLPFKSHDSHASVFSSNLFAQRQTIDFKPLVTELNNSLASKEDFIYSAFSSSIWQPPKV